MPRIPGLGGHWGQSQTYTYGGTEATSKRSSGHDTYQSRDYKSDRVPYQDNRDPHPQQPLLWGPLNLDEFQNYDHDFPTPPNSCDSFAASPSPQHASVESPAQFFFIEPSSATMSLAYENRGFAEYPQGTIMEDSSPHDHDHDHDHEHLHHQPAYDPSPPPVMNDNSYAQIESALELQMQELPLVKEDDEDTGVSPRAAPLAKPIRDVVKDVDGKFYCTWTGCTDDIRHFIRKCEYNKHMDKHDRPYKCMMHGCEKIPGFTYSGGLLRHQREVHNLHGGPRKQLNCPHPNCKRNSGKGFSRQENLNEHLRRVHTPATAEGELISPNPEETEEETAVRTGVKRKRLEQHEQQPVDVRDDMARVIHDNEILRRQVELQSTQIAELMRQLSDVQAILNPNRLSQAPQAMMG